MIQRFEKSISAEKEF